MRILSQQLRLSATDLSSHLACAHLTNLALSVVRGERVAPDPHAPDLVVIQQRGLEYEARYLQSLRSSGLEVAHFGGLKDDVNAAAETEKAMLRGVPVIAQGSLNCGRWIGRPDVLRRVDKPSTRFGEWSYEAFDCKLSRETKATAILQLSFYSELLGEIQGAPSFVGAP
jgi:uncharacterized protein